MNDQININSDFGTRPPIDNRYGSLDIDGRRAFFVLLLIALILKTIYLVQYLRLPFIYGPLFDSQVYLLQARRVLEGRFGDATLLAMSPLYGYWLSLFGPGTSNILPILAQFGLGALNLILIRDLSTRLFGAVAGLFAAGLYLAYGPLLFFESKIMSETLGLALLLLALKQMASANFARGRTRTTLLAGVSVAFAVLARASLALGVPLMILAAWFGRFGEPASAGAIITRGLRARRALVFAAGIGVVLTTYGGWTRLHSGLFVPVILVSNTASRATRVKWTGDLSVFRAADEQGVGAFSVVDQASRRLERARRGESEPPGEPFAIGALVSQAPLKLWLTLRDRETTFDYGFYGERTEAPALYACFASFGMLLAFGLLGLVYAVYRGQVGATLPLLAVAAGTALVTVMFHPSTRYRLPLLIPLLPFAGYAWAFAFGLRARKKRLWLLGLYAVVVVGFSVNQASRPLQQPGLWHLRVAEAGVEEGNIDLVRTRLARALELEPNNPEVRRRVAYIRSRIVRDGHQERLPVQSPSD